MTKFRIYYSDGVVGEVYDVCAEEVRRKADQSARSLGLMVTKIKVARGDTVESRPRRD